MKNLLKRSMAFLLVACMLLSVVPAGIFRAEAVAVEGDVITYAVDKTGFADNTSAAGQRNVSVDDGYYGDFAYVARNGGICRVIDGDPDRIQYNVFNIADGVTDWFVLKFKVEEAGNYRLKLNTKSLIADFHVEQFDENRDYNEEYITACTTEGNQSSEVVYSFAADTEYVIILKATSESTGSAMNAHFYGMTLTAVPVEVLYDLEALGNILEVPTNNHVSFHDNRVPALYEAGTINFLPYAKKAGSLGGDVYIENGYRGQGILLQGSGEGGFFALKIANPGTGIYDFTYTHNSRVNNTGEGHVYVMPISDVEAALTAAQAADANATEADAIYNLIQGDYAGKQIISANMYGDPVSGTAEFKSDEDHIVVFYAAQIKAKDDGGTQAWIDITSFKLTKWTDSRVAKAVVDMIDAIGTVTLDSEAAIVAARAAYNALTDAQKAKVTNYDTLLAAEEDLEEEKNSDPVADQAAADVVIGLIEEIDDEITLNSEDAIVAARAAYDELTERQKALVADYYETLTAAEAALQVLLDEVATGAVIEKINAIGEVTLDSETAIADARAAYDALTDDQKAQIADYYETLTAAEAALAMQKQQAAVDEVVAKIDAIGTVNKGSASVISAARTAYNALSATQKELVGNYQDLVDAEFAMKDLNNPNPDPEGFDGIVYDFTKLNEVLNISDGGNKKLGSEDQDKAYADGVVNFNFYAATKSASISNNYCFTGYHQNTLIQGAPQDWMAFRFQSPGAGTTYKLAFTFPIIENANNSMKLDAYVFPISTVENAIDGEENTAVTVISKLIADKVAAGEAPVASKNIKAASTGAMDPDDFWGNYTFTSDEEYIIVFYAAEDKNGGTSGGTWITVSGFYLTTPPTENDIAAADAVMEQIANIGTVRRDSKAKVEAIRAAYNALTEKQKGLVENLATLEAAEARLAVLLDPNNPIEYIYVNENPLTEKGYPSAVGLTYGDFIDRARAGKLTFKPYVGYVQTQSSFKKGEWYALQFTVEQAGDYDMTLNLGKSGSHDVTLDVYFIRSSDLVQGAENEKNQAVVDGLANSDYKRYQVDLNDKSTWNLEGVQLDQDKYLIVMISTSAEGEYQFNFAGFAISRTGDYTGPEKVIPQPLPDPDTDKLVYDFYIDGTPQSTNVYSSAVKELTDVEYGLNNMHWKPLTYNLDALELLAPRSATIQVGTDTDRYPWKGIAAGSGVGEWISMVIKAPGTGTYDLTLDHGLSVNGSGISNVYLIPTAKLQDMSADAIEAAIADNTYRLTNTVSFRGTLGSGSTDLGQANFEKGKEYVLVFYAAANKHSTTKLYEISAKTGAEELYEAFILPQKLTATKFVPPAPLSQKEVTYRFHRTDMGESTDVFSDKCLSAMITNYSKGLSYWKPYANTFGTALEGHSGKASYLNGNAKSYKFEAIMATTLPGEWIGFQIKSPGKGLYTLSLTYGINTNCTTQAEIHVIPLDKLSGDPVEAVNKAIATGNYKLQRDVNMKKNYGTDPKYSGGSYGQINCEIGQEFIVVFKAITNKHGTTSLIQTNKETGAQNAYQAFMILQEMKLTYATKVETFEEPEEIVPDVTGQADPEAAAAVIALINAIGKDITLESSAAIRAARTAYDLLTETQKTLVTNYQTLVDAEAKLAELVTADDKLKAEAVIEKINAIGEVTLESESKIVAARIAYTLLTTEQRALVTNYSVLLAAEAKLAELKGENSISPIDQASADAVEALIAKIGTVTLESEIYISAARNAYNALTDTQKLLVENYADLVAAERAYAELKAQQDADQAEKDAAKRKAQQITIMIISAVIAIAAAGTVAIFAVPGLREKVMALFAKVKSGKK